MDFFYSGKSVGGLAALRDEQRQPAFFGMPARGLTVIIAVAALMVIGIPLITQMGMGAAVAVFMAVVAALTLIPALLGAGLAGKAFGGTVKPNADTRSWNNLPQHLAFAALRLPPGKQTVKIYFLDASKKQIPALSRQLEIKVNPTRDTVVFVADK